MQLDNVADIYPLSPVQQGMLFHALSAPGSGVYIEQYSCKLRGNLQIPEFQAAWQQVIDRQPVLRTAFLWEGLDEPLQVVRQQVDAVWDREDWRDYPLVEQEKKLTEFLSCDRIQGFDLLQAPISRFKLIQLQDNTHQFIWSFHHVLADGWSIPIIWQEVLTCYQANCRQTAPALPPLRPYRDYIAWLKNQDTAKAETFWRSQLQGLTHPTPLPAARTTSDLSPQPYRQQSRALAPGLYGSLQAFARQHWLTLNTLIQGAWALLLSHYSQQTDVTYGSVVSGRPTDLSGVETMVGLFINTLPVRVPVEPEQSLLSWLQARQQQLLELRQYETTPLSDIQRWSPMPVGSSLFDSIVVFENYPTAASLDLGFEIQDIRYLEQSNYPLALLVVPGKSLDLLLLFDPARFEAEAIARLHEHLELLLTAFIDQPQATLAQIPRLTATEQQTVSKTIDYPKNLTIHQLIEAQVKRTPDGLAVVFEGQTLTYGELNSRADQLASWLRTQGVGPGERVALCLHPSLARIVSILAVLKAGGAYVPLDPSYPAERIEYCLQDTKPRLLLTQPGIGLPDTEVPVVYLDGVSVDASHFGESETSSPYDRSPQGPSGDDLAYIIYTSGSTGRPKGVMVSHRNLVHSTTARSHVYPEPVGRFLLLSSIAFDSSVAGIFWTLCQGGTLVLPPERIEQDLQQLATLMAQQQITHTLCVPTLYALLLDAADPRQLAKLRTVVVAGEACPRALVQRHYGKLPATDLYNEYGPTEATVWCTAYRVPAELPSGPVAIGTAIPNTQIYLLNDELQPVPTGAIGELYIGGDGVTQGYLNQPERTAAAFITDGHGYLPSTPLYKTGDLARYRANGTLEWLGRCDRQVKIRGYRIELGEIEDVLRSQPTIQEAVVVARSTTDSLETIVERLATLTPEQAETLLAAAEGGE
ncbi:MAG: amino acid adenylation domain-containing protein [Cyanobacteria bacterium J06554_1]